MDVLRQALKNWSSRSNELTKLQVTYVMLSIGLLVLAGLVSLINPNLGSSILLFAIWTLLLFIANAVIWALIDTFLIRRLDTKVSKQGPASQKRSVSK